MTLVIVYSIPRQPLNGSKQYTKTNLLLTYVWPDQFNYFKKSMDFLILFEGSVSLKNNWILKINLCFEAFVLYTDQTTSV